MRDGLDTVVTAVRDSIGGSEPWARELIKSVFEGIEDQLREGKTVCIPNFGTFTMKTYPAATKMVNVIQKEVELPERKRIVFKTARKVRYGNEQ